MRILMLVDYYQDGNYVGTSFEEVEIDLILLAELELITALLTCEAAFGDLGDEGDTDDDDFGDWDNDDLDYEPTALVHVPGASVQRREYVRPANYVDVDAIVAEALATG